MLLDPLPLSHLLGPPPPLERDVLYGRPHRRRPTCTLNRLIKNDETGSSNRKPPERIRTARTPANIARVSELISSQDDDLGIRKFRGIQRETGISRSTVRRIAKDDLKLKIFRRREVQQLSDSEAKKRLQACMRIKQRMTVDKIERLWFYSDEKIFTAQATTNTQNDLVYARVLRKRDLIPGSVKCVVNLLLLTEKRSIVL